MPDNLPATITLNNLPSAIRLAVIRFQYRFNTTPTMIYLGRRESEILDAIIQETNRYLVGDPTGKTRRVWEDREVFVVDANEHLSVGVQP